MEGDERVTKGKMFIIMLAVAAVSFGAGSLLSEEKYVDDSDEISNISENDDCNVLGLNLHGTLLTYIPLGSESDFTADQDVVSSEDILYYLEEAEKDDDIKGVLVEVDSVGGWPVAGEEVAEALKRFEKPSVSVIRQSGLSAAYYAISSADKILASQHSDVGSIGVTVSYLENTAKNTKEGLSFVDLSSARFKDTGDPNKPLTAEERALFMRDIKIVHDNFVEAVSLNRKIPIERVRALADGSSVLGEKAKELGLIDEIGGIYEAKKYLSEKIGEEVEVCWY